MASSLSLPALGHRLRLADYDHRFSFAGSDAFLQEQEQEQELMAQIKIRTVLNVIGPFLLINAVSFQEVE